MVISLSVKRKRVNVTQPQADKEQEVRSQNLQSGAEGGSLPRQRYGGWSEVSQVDPVATISDEAEAA